MPLTLKDIAKMAGVAESTVSRAINNKPGVGEKTREKIMSLVEKYDFKPNQLARGLAKSKTGIIALLLSDLTKPGYSEISKKVEEIANQAGYQVVLCNNDNNPEKEKGYLNLVTRNRVDGAIIVGGELADKNIINLALNNKKSLVLVNRMAEELLIPTILVDNAHGGYLATNHLLEQGLTKIAIIMGSQQDFLESERLNGYQQALKEHQLPVKSEYIISTDGSRESGFNAFLGLMELTEIPEAFFVTSDLLAVGLTEAIKMGGYLIPDEFAIVSYGETLVSSIVNPRLTVIVEPLSELGKLAAQYLFKLLNDQTPENLIRVLEPVLKVKESSIRT